VYIQLALDLGPDKVAETAVDMGIKRRHVHGYPAESLGGLERGVSPLEMATAYATIASGGYRNRPTAITKVEFETTGKSELPRRWRPHRTKVFSDGVTYEATKILEQNIQAGTGTRANIGCPAAGKTGTTDRNTDAWFVGFTPRLATAVWVGYPNDRTEMNGLFYGGNVDGGTFPAAIWGEYMKSIKGSFCGAFPQPKEPFVSQPFFGSYSSNGGNKLGLGSSDEEETPSDDSTNEPEPTPDQDQGDNNGGGTEFDPEQYESPPQEAPDTGTPP
jgi:penicillin-binding protein 1A